MYNTLTGEESILKIEQYETVLNFLCIPVKTHTGKKLTYRVVKKHVTLLKKFPSAVF